MDDLINEEYISGSRSHLGIKGTFLHIANDGRLLNFIVSTVQ